MDLPPACSSARATSGTALEVDSSYVILCCVPFHFPDLPDPAQMETLMIITPSINFLFVVTVFFSPIHFA